MVSRLTPLIEACEAAPLELEAAEALRSAVPALARGGKPPAGLEALYARGRAALLRVPPAYEVPIAQQLARLAAACDAAPTDAAAAEQLRRLLESAGGYRWGGDTGSRAVLKAVHEHARAALWRVERPAREAAERAAAEREAKREAERAERRAQKQEERLRAQRAKVVAAARARIVAPVAASPALAGLRPREAA